MAIKVLGKIHHTVIIGVSLIKLHKGKLRVVSGVKTFVSEHSAYLVHPVKSAYYEPLKIQLKRDSELYILVKGVVVGLKGSRARSAGVGNQHGGLHLYEALCVEVVFLSS